MKITHFIVPANSTLWRYSQDNVFSRFITTFGHYISLDVCNEMVKCLYRSCGNTRITTFRLDGNGIRLGGYEIGFRICPKSISIPPRAFEYRGALYRQRIADKLRSYDWR